MVIYLSQSLLEMILIVRVVYIDKHSVSVVMTVVVLNCHYKGPSAKSVPGWMKRLIIPEMGFFISADP